VRSQLAGAPAAGSEPVEPPFLQCFVLVAGFKREVGAGRRPPGERRKADRRAKLIHMISIGDGPGTGETVAGIVDALRAEALRTAFVESDAVLEESGLPGRDAALFDACLNEAKCSTHELRCTDGMLRDEPGSFGAVGSDAVFGGPAVLGDKFAKSRGILDVDGFHAGMVGAPEFAGGEEFFAES